MILRLSQGSKRRWPAGLIPANNKAGAGVNQLFPQEVRFVGLSCFSLFPIINQRFNQSNQIMNPSNRIFLLGTSSNGIHMHGQVGACEMMHLRDELTSSEGSWIALD